MKIVNVVGARPQFIKLAPLSRAIKKYSSNNELKELIVHTGQHYDYEMSNIFFDELNINKPNYNLGVGSSSHGEQTGLMLRGIEKILKKEVPDIVLVYGDTNSTLAGSLASSKEIYKNKNLKQDKHIPFVLKNKRPVLVHVEAGLRSFTEKPEEINRILTDRISDLLFCPTKKSVQNLKKEGFVKIVDYKSIIEKNNIFLKEERVQIAVRTGDLMLDSVLYTLKKAQKRSKILESLNLKDSSGSTIKNYYLCTVHKSKNTDNRQRLKEIVGILKDIAKASIVVCPLHPRTIKKMKAYSLFNSMDQNRNIKIVSPLSYLDMLILERNAKVVLTDSGGVQKEAFFLGTPCITLRNYTEWEETVDSGWNILAGINKEIIQTALKNFATIKKKDKFDFYGDGSAAEKMVQIIRSLSEN